MYPPRIMFSKQILWRKGGEKTSGFGFVLLWTDRTGLLFCLSLLLQVYLISSARLCNVGYSDNLREYCWPLHLIRGQSLNKNSIFSWEFFICQDDFWINTKVNSINVVCWEKIDHVFLNSESLNSRTQNRLFIPKLYFGKQGGIPTRPVSEITRTFHSLNQILKFLSRLCADQKLLAFDLDLSLLQREARICGINI